MLSLGLRWAVQCCRQGADGAVGSLLAGEIVENAELRAVLPDEVFDLLEHDDLLLRPCPDAIRFAMRLIETNQIVSLLPADQEVDHNFVHLNVDSLWLVHLVWKHASPAQSAVEMGTGNGLVAAHLTARYNRVVATDLPGPWLDFAQLTLAANAARGRQTMVLASDVATALKPESFDLVASNTPWAPAMPTDGHGRQMVFADGGPTGTELPRRFIREGAELLRPGGTAISLCFDPTFDDGRRPLMAELDGLARRGFSIEIIDSEVFDPDIVTTRLKRRRLPDLKSGRHIAVIVRRSS